MDDPQIHAKWKKPDTKDSILYDSIYMTCPRIGKKKKKQPLERKWISSCCLGLGGGRGGDGKLMGTELLWRDTKMS